MSRFDCPSAACCGCGADLADAPATAWRRHQVTDIEPAPAPKSPSTWRRPRSARAAGRPASVSCRRMCGRGPVNGPETALLVGARDAAGAARLAGQPVLDGAVLDDLVTRYRALAPAGLP